ncbi:MAG: hypothetical protein JEZ00_19815 [Anaerolineaceae bacterium]|nr:hypothetical protein [Anaerolineaceae bacterium]
MKAEFLKKYAHTWRLFERIVNDFEADAWLHAGRGEITPAGYSLHILQSVKYYIEDTAPIQFESGKLFEPKWHTVSKGDLPSQADIVACMKVFQQKTEQWLNDMDFSAKNTSFNWAGETRLGVVLFNLHHMVFHIGELSALLNESKNGDVEDHYVKSV